MSCWGVAFLGGLRLPCTHLGVELPIEELALQLHEYFVSTLDYSVARHALLITELAAMLERCRKLALSLLYRCPKECADVDFFVLCPDGNVFTIQTSISALLVHSDIDTICSIPLRFGIPLEHWSATFLSP